jgi:hypothetical protein
VLLLLVLLLPQQLLNWARIILCTGFKLVHI